jgi:ribosomal protein S18 acetylase RimI-like enzyme
VDPVNVSIRPTSPEDLDDVTRLYLALKEHHSQLRPDIPRYRVSDGQWEKVADRALRDPDLVTLVAEAGGRVVGFTKLAFVEKPWGLSCEIDTMVVEDAYRNRGIGAEMLRAAEVEAYRRDAKGLRVDVLLENYDGREFYQRAGFEPFSVRYGKPVREPD